MVNFKAIIAILVIIIVIMILVMIRCLCWKWLKKNYCPKGCCIDDRPVIVTVTPPNPNAPPPPYNPEFERGEGQ